MATLHQATLTPTKRELLAAWLPTQPWFDGDVAALTPVGSFRLDDPDGEVGLEMTLVTAGDDRLWFVPVTYRAEPLDGGAEHLVGVMEHSVLGTRHTYDAAGDPVALAVLRATIAEAGRQADLVRDLGDGRTEPVPSPVAARGTGGDGVDVVIERRPAAAEAADLADGSGALVADLEGREALVLARLA